MSEYVEVLTTLDALRGGTDLTSPVVLTRTFCPLAMSFQEQLVFTKFGTTSV